MYDKKLSDIMSTELKTLKPNDSLLLVESLFKSHAFHHLPVVDTDQQVIGIISKSNFLQLQDSITFFCEKKGEERNSRLFKTLIVEEVMTKPVATLSVDDTVGIAVGLFKENSFHAIPIVDEENRLTGIVTTFDLLNFAFP